MHRDVLHTPQPAASLRARSQAARALRCTLSPAQNARRAPSSCHQNAAHGCGHHSCTPARRCARRRAGAAPPAAQCCCCSGSGRSPRAPAGGAAAAPLKQRIMGWVEPPPARLLGRVLQADLRGWCNHTAHSTQHCSSVSSSQITHGRTKTRGLAQLLPQRNAGRQAPRRVRTLAVGLEAHTTDLTSGSAANTGDASSAAAVKAAAAALAKLAWGCAGGGRCKKACRQRVSKHPQVQLLQAERGWQTTAPMPCQAAAVWLLPLRSADLPAPGASGPPMRHRVRCDRPNPGPIALRASGPVSPAAGRPPHLGRGLHGSGLLRRRHGAHSRPGHAGDGRHLGECA